MARRRFHAMTRSGVSIRLIPTALALDALGKTGIPSAFPSGINSLANPSTYQYIGQTTLQNAGGIILDVLGAILWTKVFPRTPGLRLGRFRVSL